MARNFNELTDNEKETLESSEIVSQYDTKNMPWSVKTLNGKIQKDTARFDNAVQRSTVWTKEQKSLLIHSFIIHAPVPPLYAVKGEDGAYDFIDGKQRSMAINEFLEDKFELVDIPSVSFDGFDDEVDLNGLKFSELPQTVKDAILDFSLTIYAMEDMTEDDVADVFMRLNNGKSLSQIEKTRVYAPSMDTIKELTHEDIFEEAFTEKQRTKYYDEDVVIKLFKLFDDDVKDWSLDSKDVRDFLKDFEATNEEVNKVKDALSTLREIHENITMYDSDTYVTETRKLARRVAKKIYNRTNLVTLSYFFEGKDEVDTTDAADFLLYFFSEARGSSVSPQYNADCRDGSNHASKVGDRQDILNEFVDKFLNDNEIRDSFTETKLVEKDVTETEVA